MHASKKESKKALLPIYTHNNTKRQQQYTHDDGLARKKKKRERLQPLPSNKHYICHRHAAPLFLFSSFFLRLRCCFAAVTLLVGCRCSNSSCPISSEKILQMEETVAVPPPFPQRDLPLRHIAHTQRWIQHSLRNERWWRWWSFIAMCACSSSIYEICMCALWRDTKVEEVPFHLYVRCTYY